MPQPEFTEGALESSLRRAFVGNSADYIIVDSRDLSSPFLRAAVQQGISQGLLEQGKDIDEDKILGRGVGQYRALTYHLTEKGKRHFRLQNAA